MEEKAKPERVYKNIYGVVSKVTKIPPDQLREWDTKLGNIYEVEISVLDDSGIKGSPSSVPTRLKMDKAYEAGTRLYLRVSSSGRFLNFIGVIDEIPPAPKK